MQNKNYSKKLYSIEQAEKENLIFDNRLGTEPIPFGFVNDQWEELKSIMKESDKLYKFKNNSKSWIHLAGKEGFELERNGKVVISIITTMN